MVSDFSSLKVLFSSPNIKEVYINTDEEFDLSLLSGLASCKSLWNLSLRLYLSPYLYDLSVINELQQITKLTVDYQYYTDKELVYFPFNIRGENDETPKGDYYSVIWVPEIENLKDLTLNYYWYYRDMDTSLDLSPLSKLTNLSSLSIDLQLKPLSIIWPDFEGMNVLENLYLGFTFYDENKNISGYESYVDDEMKAMLQKMRNNGINLSMYSPKRRIPGDGSSSLYNMFDTSDEIGQ